MRVPLDTTQTNRSDAIQADVIATPKNATSHDTAFCALPAIVRTDQPLVVCWSSELVIC